MWTVIAELLPSIMGVIKKVVPDADARAQAQEDITRLLIEQQGQIYDSMKEVMVADAQSDNKYTSASRPTVVYWSLAMITFIAVAGLFHQADFIIQALRAVPSDLYDLMKIGIGGYTLVRGVEKGIKYFKSS